MKNQSEIATPAPGYADQAREAAQGWSQCALLVLAWLGAVVASRRAGPFLTTRAPALIRAAVARLDFVADFRVNGLDDGKNEFRPQVLFAIWNALKDGAIEIPCPRRAVEIRGGRAS